MMSRRHLWMLITAVCAIAALKGAWHLWEVLSLEVRGAIDSDALLYFTVGRGILNGLTPWADLFESKPPGMFLIAALSLIVTGDELLAIAMQIGVFLSIPALLGIWTWHEARGRERLERATLTLLAAIMGIAVTLYLEEHAGGIQSESFGAFAGGVYAWLLLRWKNRVLRWKELCLLAIPVATAVILKEPFLLPLLAVALLLAERPGRAALSFAVPAGLAVAASFLLIAIAGWWDAYAHIYLPSMLGGRVYAGAADPVWVRGLSVGRVWGNLTWYYTAPLLGVLLAGSWLVSPVLDERRRPAARDILLTAGTCLAGYAVMRQGFLYALQFGVWRMGAQLRDPLPWDMPHAVYVVLAAAFAMLLFLMLRRGLLYKTIRACAALYLSAAVVGIASYSANHFAFAVPVYLAILMLFLSHAAGDARSPWVFWPIAAAAVAGALVYVPSAEHRAALQSRLQYSSSALGERTRRLDSLLDACGIERFGALDTTLQTGVTKHSPLGPLLQRGFFKNVWPADHPLFQETHERVTRDARILVTVRDEQDTWGMQPVIEQTFTRIPPACAAPHLPIDGIDVWFRAGAEFRPVIP